MICIYHSRDLDGFASAAIVKRKYPDAILIGYDYGQELPMNRIPPREPIIMVDVSMPMQGMEQLARYSNWQLTWIDHHASAIKDFSDFVDGGQSFCETVLKSGIAACELTWKHLFPTKYMPASIEMLGAYDTWRNDDKEEWNDEVLPFQYGMRSVCNSPETFPEELLNIGKGSWEKIKNIMVAGANILSYQAQTSALMCRRGAFEFNLVGLRMICLNSNGCNSITFDSVYDESKHDVMMPFFFDGKKWIFSLYTTKEDIDCSVIAKLRGGGGHKKAAGFEATSFESVFGER